MTESPGGLVALRNLEALDNVALRTLTAALGQLAGRQHPPWILATYRNGDAPLGEDQRRQIERFGAVELRLPSLRERPEDIAVLAGELVRRHRRDPSVHLSGEALSALRRLPWPGNVRQLEAVIRSLAASRLGEITAACLPPELRVEGSQRQLTPIEQLEFEAIAKALQHSNGNKVQAAKMIGLSRSTIYRKMRAYGIEDHATFF
jgi:DNA-binding NtrC family response regulator